MFNFKLKTNNEHKFSLVALGVSVLEQFTGIINYSSKTKMKNVHVRARFLAPRIRYNTKMTVVEILKARVKDVAVLYKSGTTALMSAITSIFGKVSYKSISEAKEKISIRVAESEVYKSLSSINEQLFMQLISNTIKYKSIITEEASTGMLAKLSLILKQPYKLSMKTSATLRGAFFDCYKITAKMIESLGFSGSGDSKYKQSTTSVKDGVNARVKPNDVNVIQRIADAVNILSAKARLKGFAHSRTDMHDEKLSQFYTTKLSNYKATRLNETPSDLFEFCYIVNKNWSFISKRFKLWSEIKNRLSSWHDLLDN